MDRRAKDTIAVFKKLVHYQAELVERRQIVFHQKTWTSHVFSLPEEITD
jgi:hypothetical protein